MSYANSETDSTPTSAPPNKRQVSRSASRPGWSRTFGALRHRNFRLFWFGQAISMTGTWVQSVALAWLVLELTNSAFLLGLVSALNFLPIMLLSVFAGVVIDRFPKRETLLFTQTSAMVLAFILAVLTATGLVQIWHVMILALCVGAVNSLDWPLRQAFVVEMVGKEDLMNGIGLNNALFNGSRVFGPAIGGLLIGWVGIGTCFYVNGISFLAVIGGLLAIKINAREQRRASHGSIWLSLAEGFRYIRHTRLIWMAMALLAVTSLFGMNFMVILPLIARVTFRLDADGFGYLSAIMGLGSLMGSFAAANLRRNPSLKAILSIVVIFGGLEVILAVESMGVTAEALQVYATPIIVAAAILIAAIGLTYVLFTTMSNSMIQFDVPDHLRGRVMSVYVLVMGGTTPLGNLASGAIAYSSGPPAPLLLGGLICVLAALAAMRASVTERQSASHSPMSNQPGT